MDKYSWLRELADSWVLLAMFAFYVGAILWVFRPGSRRLHDESAQIPLRDDMSPLPAGNGDRSELLSTEGK